MKTKKIQFKNIASYGEEVQEIDLTGPAAFYQVVGANGRGKTTIAQVMKYGWYGKVDGAHGTIHPKDLANRTNKNGWIRIEGESRGREVVAEWTITPNTMNLTIDGQPYDKARYRGAGPKEYLADELAEFPFHVYCNVISMNLHTFKSLITIGTEDKRKIVDRMMGYHVINVMREVLSKEHRALRSAIDQASARADQAGVNLERGRKAFDDLSKKIATASADYAAQARVDLEKFSSMMEMHEKRSADFRKRRAASRAELDTVLDALTRAKSVEASAKQALSLFENDKCPTCGADLDSDEHDGMRAELESTLSKASAAREVTEASVAAARSAYSALEVEQADILDKGNKIATKMSSLTEEIRKHTAPDDSQLSELSRLIEVNQAEIEEIGVARARDEMRAHWAKVLEQAAGDGGIKRVAMSRIIPAFNAEIARMMAAMHLDYCVTFDENFDATITQMGEVVPVPTLSFGEVKKVDFVVLAAWIRLMKMKHPSMNVLFLDEIFSSVDADGIHSILQILHGMCAELGLNIFVISHNPLPQEVFDYKVVVEKKNGFSTLRVERE